jgi:hypothetical protein
MYLTHLGIRIQRGSFHIYLKKVGFLDSKRLLSPSDKGKIYFFSTLNVMISQMVRNESVRFGRHIDIEVSYKILWLEIPKLVIILHYLTCFQKELFGGNFEQKHLGPLGVKNISINVTTNTNIKSNFKNSYWLVFIFYKVMTL